MSAHYIQSNVKVITPQTTISKQLLHALSSEDVSRLKNMDAIPE